MTGERVAVGLKKPLVAKLLPCVIKAAHVWGLLASATAAPAVLRGAQPGTGLTLVVLGEHRFSGRV